MLTLEEIRLNKQKIKFLSYLETSGFYEVLSSFSRHHNWRGGLAQHCLGVYQKALEMRADLLTDSLIIAGLLHDICKAGKYYYDEKGQLHHRQTHIKHGRRSIILLERCGLEMIPEEYRAIRWHMGGHHVYTEKEKYDVELARNELLWSVIHNADHINAKENI